MNYDTTQTEQASESFVNGVRGSKKLKLQKLETFILEKGKFNTT